MIVTGRGFWFDDTGEGMPYGWPRSLAEWIAEYLSRDKTVPIYDFGCGPGNFLQVLSEAGFTRLTGYEGAPMAVERRAYTRIVEQDISVPFTVPEPGHVLCLEVLEHVPEPLLPAALDNIARAVELGHHLIASWAVRGQTGVGHVSERDNYEAIAQIQARGLTLLEEATRQARSGDYGAQGCPWFNNTLLVFGKGR